MSERLYKTCIYAIAKAEKLDEIYNKDGKGELEEDRSWVTAKEHLRAAKQDNLELPILFSDAARDTSSLIYWAVLDEIKLDEARDKTRYSFSRLRILGWGDHATQELILESTGKRIAPGFIRSYAICQTPEFLNLELQEFEESGPAPIDPETD